MFNNKKKLILIPVISILFIVVFILELSKKKVNNKLLLVLIIVVFIGIFVFILNASYGFFTTQANSKNYIAYTGTLQVDFTKDSNVINLNNTVPLTNQEGLAANNNIYRFSVANNGTVDAKYQVRLEVLKQNSKEYIPLEYIKLAYSTDGTNFTTVKSLTGQNSGEDVVEFSAVNARYVRMQGVKRALPYGYSLWEMTVFGK